VIIAAPISLNRAVVSGGTTYLVEEDCEGTGRPDGWTDTGSPDWDATDIVLAGSQSLKMAGAATPPRTHYDLGTACSEIWVRFLFLTNSTATSVSRLLSLRNQSGDTEVAHVQRDTSGKVIITHGTATAQVVTDMEQDTDYVVWVHYKAGSGANGVMDIAFSTDGTRPTSGDNFASLTNGSATSSIDRVQLRAQTTNTGMYYFFDDITIDDSEIGNA
jgi:hypothetical protein